MILSNDIFYFKTLMIIEGPIKKSERFDVKFIDIYSIAFISPFKLIIATTFLHIE